MTPTFSIIHPTARPARGWQAAYESWAVNATCPSMVEYVLSVHITRWQGEGSVQFPTLPSMGRVVVSTERDCVVDNCNRAAAESLGAVIVGAADDMFAYNGWDEDLDTLLSGQFGERFEDREFMVNLVPGPMTHGCMSRRLYERWGYLACPEYVSMYCDDDNRERAIHEGVPIVEAGHLPFEHRHHSRGLRAYDEVDARHACPETYRVGLEALERRRAAGWRST